MRNHKPTKRELDASIQDLQQQIYDIEAKFNELADHLGLWIRSGPSVVKMGKELAKG